MTAQGTERRCAILRYLLRRRGYAVSFRGIADGVGLTAPSTAYRHMLALRDDGLVAWEPRMSRTIRLLPDGVELAEALEREASE